ncbi:t-complex protein epsilon subunit (TCP-1-epsilon) [Cyclospora cayetanensis]|uniref:T-complex protein 1 subunit epsilon n=1 Tax=Cyclospora cayetanensis TaxID=88456 RepID=A0A1D3CVJ3_9EIME|nr:t-complex protein epsilon subunit (TCP-1-epsilon) [Cyclospora cayetanensis]
MQQQHLPQKQGQWSSLRGLLPSCLRAESARLMPLGKRRDPLQAPSATALLAVAALDATAWLLQQAAATPEEALRPPLWGGLNAAVAARDAQTLFAETPPRGSRSIMAPANHYPGICTHGVHTAEGVVVVSLPSRAFHDYTSSDSALSSRLCLCFSEKMNIATDEFGNPFIILREQEEKKRLKGANITAAKAVADSLRSSLGPKGMDKLVVGPDGDITVTNDGACILDKMQIKHQCAKLLVELSRSQDAEIGDGTTGVVILAGNLLSEALRLIEKGLHPLRIADGFEAAAQIAVEALEKAAIQKDVLDKDQDLLRQTAKTALGSKVVSSCKERLAELCVEAVLAVADKERRDVNLDMIKLDGRAGGLLEQSTLVRGIVLHKDLSHSQMPKEINDARIAILTCPFEPPKPKTKHKLDIKNAEDYKKLQAAEQQYFKDMIQRVKEAGANFVICQWGFDDEANHLFLAEGVPAVRWVGGVELELVAIASKGRIVPRVSELEPSKLGRAGCIREICTGTMGDKMIVIEGCSNSRAVTLVVYGGNQMVVAEAERSVHDALCVVSALVRDGRVVSGGGASEIAAARAVEAAADRIPSVSQYAARAFGEALLGVAEALAANSGLSAIQEVQRVKAMQQQQDCPYYGIDCMQTGTNDMRQQQVWEPFASKQQQILLATQVVKMILKIDDVITPNDE